MAYTGSIELISGIKQANGQNFPLVDASAVRVTDNKRLDEVLSEKGSAGGYASLDDSGKVPASQLPSYVDDVLEYDSLSVFPQSGETGKIYVAKDTGKVYRWSGTAYIEISDNAASIVNITRSGNTFTATRADGTTFTFAQKDDDTKNTAGTTNKPATKLFLTGAQEQGANPQTYSNANVYIGADNKLCSEGLAAGSGVDASGVFSTAEGESTTASGRDTHAEGNGTKATGAYSHSQGYWTEANHRSQSVLGEFNVLDPSSEAAINKGNYIEIVGNGTYTSSRSNARTLDWNGNERLAGNLYVGCNPDSTGGSKVATVVDIQGIIDDTAGNGDTDTVWSSSKTKAYADSLFAGIITGSGVYF